MDKERDKLSQLDMGLLWMMKGCSASTVSSDRRPTVMVLISSNN